jgi:hypothetical protein
MFFLIAMLVFSYFPQEKVWVYFTNKGFETEEERKVALRRAKESLSERSLKRRLMIRSPENVVDSTDIPLCEEYIREVEAIGGRLCEVSKWLNAATFIIPSQKDRKIEELPFVKKIEPVMRFTERITEKSKGIDYGEGKPQIELLGIDEVHKKGYIGEGILIGILDTGYKKDFHPALKDINIVAEYDFISNDSLARYDESDTIDMRDKSQIEHGSKMLSLIGARATGQLVGAAFGADFAIARTELIKRAPNDNRDIIAEEGWWIAGVEFLDSVGIDIISSSLGYKEWYDSTSYRYEDMDGNTTRMSKVAAMCVSKNILLVTAMGNIPSKNPTSRPDTCIKAPADADSIIACGGVDENGEWYWQENSGSAIGPPYDQIWLDERTRWKPDVCGPWTGYVANPWWRPGDENNRPYSTTGGTSCATAMVAGAAACILSGHREDGEGWDARRLRDAILKTASRSENPDDTLGYGVPNAFKALYYEKPIVFPAPFDEDRILYSSPSPFIPGDGKSLRIYYRLVNNATVMNLYIFTLSGRLIKEFKKYDVAFGDGYIEWNGRDEEGNPVTSGIYICLLETGIGKSVGKIAIIR